MRRCANKSESARPFLFQIDNGDHIQSLESDSNHLSFHIGILNRIEMYKYLHSDGFDIGGGFNLFLIKNEPVSFI